ncbi:hypothetical protein OHT76_05860 [Streptomyces sp. NBC_00287]|uniref:hypothetical protein n=1 Tax=Streptomyces sp. NBC_00287 TaxID=2975702 RepID=UPI002E2BC954|nr:hypothetical protein [Streptomyces sp. NBC_00287]
MGTASIPICLDKESVVVGRLMSGSGEEPVHVCDGTVFLEPMVRAGAPCGCPKARNDQMTASRLGTGPKPDVCLRFRLAEEPEVGLVSLISHSWQCFDSVRAALNAAADRDGVQWKLVLRNTAHTTRSGLVVSYAWPELVVAT